MEPRGLNLSHAMTTIVSKDFWILESKLNYSENLMQNHINVYFINI